MRLSHTILYVSDVAASLAFWQRAFGIGPGFVHDSGDYAELAIGDAELAIGGAEPATGGTKLAFAAHGLVETLFDATYRESDPKRRPIGFEVTLEVDDVAAAFRRAVDAGAEALAEPVDHPWGQTVAYVRDGDGAIVALGSPMDGSPS